MAIEDTELEIPSRDQIIQQHLRYRQMWNPLIDISEGGEPDHAARVAADTFIPVVALSRRLAAAAFAAKAEGDDVAFWGKVYRVRPSLATGSVGFVRISASAGGGEIQEGDILTIRGRPSGPRFACRRTGRYFDGQSVPVRSVDTGNEVNLSPGVVLEWYQPPPGIGQLATVVDQDGRGLTGGHAAATPAEHKEAILDKIGDPPGAENDSHYRLAARDAGLPIEQAFSYPAVFGPATTGILPIMRPSGADNSRLPTEQHLRIIGDHLETAFGSDDSVAMMFGQYVDRTIAYKVDFQNSSWANSVPWPRYAAEESAIVIGTVTGALSFQIKTVGGSYSGVTAPQVGDRIALYDKTERVFREKRIGTVSGSGPWTVTIDTTNGASDEDYVPVDGQRISPWSASLATLLREVLKVFDTLGPGEVVNITNAPDGYRRLRRPFPHIRWPYRLTQNMLEEPLSTKNVSVVKDRELMEGDGAEPPVGIAGVVALMIRLGDIGFFPKS